MAFGVVATMVKMEDVCLMRALECLSIRADWAL